MKGDVYLGAIAALESERAELIRSLERIDQALECLRAIAFVQKPQKARPEKTARRVVKRQKPAPSRAVAAPSAGVVDIILRELESGPKATSELAKAVGVSVFTVRGACEAMAAAGRVHRTGTGAQNYRWNAGKAA